MTGILASLAPAWGDETPASVSRQTLEPLTVQDRAPIRNEPAEPSEFPGEVIAVPSQGETSLTRVMSRSTSLAPVNSGGDDAVVFSVRGQDPIQTRYFLEGVPLTDAEYNAANLALLPMEMLGQVEVYPQGVPVFLAEDGLGGAVHFRARELGGQTRSEFGTRVGSYQSVRGYAEQEVASPIALRIHADYAQADEDYLYYDDNGTPLNPGNATWQRRANNGFRGFTLMPVARLWETGTHTLNLFSLTSVRRSEIPGPTELPSQAVLSQTFETAGLTLSSRWSRSWGTESSLYTRWNAQHLDNPNPLPSYPPADSRDIAIGARTRALWDAPRWHAEAMAGVLLEDFRVAPVALSPLDVRRTEIPFGTLVTWSPGPEFSLRPALLGHLYAYDLAQAAGAAIGMTPERYALLSPRIGLQGLWSHAWQWHVSAGRFYRAPTLYELYGAPTGVTPSRNLSYEHAWKVEGGIDARAARPFEGIREAKAYYAYSVSRAGDLIAYLPNSQQTSVAVNIGESLIQAHELGGELRAEWPIRLKTGVTFLDTLNLSDVPSQYGQPLPMRPGYRIAVELDWESRFFSAGYTYTLDGPVFADLAGTERLDAVSDHGIWVTYDTRLFGAFTLEVRNLADTMTVGAMDNGYAITDNTTGYFGFPAPGRRVYLTWKYDI
jgi:iron complex outermembrane receptor protein